VRYVSSAKQQTVNTYRQHFIFVLLLSILQTSTRLFDDDLDNQLVDTALDCTHSCRLLGSLCWSRIAENVCVTLVMVEVCLSRRHTQQSAACDAASVHFGPTIRRTDILVRYLLRGRCGPRKEQLLRVRTIRNNYPICGAVISEFLSVGIFTVTTSGRVVNVDGVVGATSIEGFLTAD